MTKLCNSGLKALVYGCTNLLTRSQGATAFLFFFRAKYKSGVVTGLTAACGNNTQSAKRRLGGHWRLCRELPSTPLSKCLCASTVQPLVEVRREPLPASEQK